MTFRLILLSTAALTLAACDRLDPTPAEPPTTAIQPQAPAGIPADTIERALPAAPVPAPPSAQPTTGTPSGPSPTPA